MNVKFYAAVPDERLRFAVIVARSRGMWVFCRHRERTTYEIPGGHREPGETILAAAGRELREETGALAFDLTPVCVYSVTGRNRVNATGAEMFGMLFYAEIQTFEKELHSEIEQVCLFNRLPSAWTYPSIQPALIAHVISCGYVKNGDH